MLHGLWKELDVERKIEFENRAHEENLRKLREMEECHVCHHFSLLVQLSSFSFAVTMDKKDKNERTEYLLPPEGKEPLQDGN